ncbi:MAG: tripartite tricarboxylate transporter substrate binding protein, partial [Burkholderiales bacterium]|nr:tripartite tricarboxylate transporter substrate binding protein [Burkholderiales bacterium]
QKALAPHAFEPVVSPPAELARRIALDGAKWTKLVKTLKMKLD